MKATLPRQQLLDALAAAATVAGGRTTKPILSCVKLEAADEQAVLSATDGETGLRISAAAISVDEPGEAVVRASDLLGIIREMHDIEVSLAADDRYVTVRGEGSEFKIFTMPAGDFPPVAMFEDEPDLTLSGHELRRMINMTIYAAARETSRYAINGVQWEKQGKRLFLVATDGRRLARSGGSLASADSADFQVIVPAKALQVYDRVFAPPKEDAEWRVDVKIMPNQVLLRSGKRMLSSVLVEGHFPKYQDVIPKGNSKRARVDRNEFYSAVRRAALLTTEESRAVRLSFEDDKLVLTSQSPEQGEARVEMPMQYDGEKLEIGFNPAFIGDALKAVTYEELYIELDDAARPGLICGEDKNEFLYVVMPVSL